MVVLFEKNPLPSAKKLILPFFNKKPYVFSLYREPYVLQRRATPHFDGNMHISIVIFNAE